MLCSGGQHELCNAHMGVLEPETTTAVCGADWPASLLPFTAAAKHTTNIPQAYYMI